MVDGDIAATFATVAFVCAKKAIDFFTSAVTVRTRFCVRNVATMVLSFTLRVEQLPACRAGIVVVVEKHMDHPLSRMCFVLFYHFSFALSIAS